MTLPVEVEAQRAFIESEVLKCGAELLEIRCYRTQGRSSLTVIVDKIGGISLDECSQINRSLSEYLDALAEGQDGLEVSNSFFKGRYYLEVSSPGIDRPLKTERDFVRAIGDKVTFYTLADNRRKTMVGRIESVDKGVIYLRMVGQEQKIVLPLEHIEKAVRVIEFKSH